MHAIPTIPTETYQYTLPPDRIAQFPLPDRDASKLLIWHDGMLSEDFFSGLSNHISPGSLMVFNNTRVIHARLHFKKTTGATIEIFCLEPLEPATDLSIAFNQRGKVTWKCLIGNARRWSQGDLYSRFLVGGKFCTLTASGKRELSNSAFAVTFSWDTPAFSFGEILAAIGQVPLPPYITREAVESDQTRYQTVFAQHDGSVAAPTAGLHFTGTIFEQLCAAGISSEEVTLHVGLGTFRPVTETTVNAHTMHQEPFTVTRQCLSSLLNRINDPVIAVGTTAVRTLESLYWIGVRLADDPRGMDIPLAQWYPYDSTTKTTIPATEAIEHVIHWLKKNNMDALSATTRLMILPGYRFRMISGMVTNFHQPASTLLLLVAAFIGDDWKMVYQYALDHQFRFLSYGDACLFLRDQRIFT